MKTTEVLNKFLKGKNLRPNSIRNYTYSMNYLAKFSPDFPSKSGEINEWLHWLTSQHLNDTSIFNCYTLVKSVANYMSRHYDLPNPFKNDKGTNIVDRPGVARKHHRIYKSETLATIINACETDDERTLLLTFIDSSCRTSDLADLKGKMIEDNSFTVPGKEGESTYRLDPKLCLILKAMAGDPDSYVFKASRFSPAGRHPGLHTSGNALSMRIRRICIRAGITGNKIGAHTLRHSSGSLIARKTGSPLAVKALLQHADIKTSMVYIHEVEEEIARDTSPLKLLGEDIFKSDNPNFKQTAMLTAGTSTEIIPLETTPPDPTDSLLQSSYPIVPEGTHIRAALNYEDILLIRRAFIALSQYGQVIPDGSASRTLFRRMIRKVHDTKSP